LRDDVKNDKIPFQSPAYFSYLDFQHNSIMTVSLPLVQYVATAAQKLNDLGGVCLLSTH